MFFFQHSVCCSFQREREREVCGNHLRCRGTCLSQEQCYQVFVQPWKYERGSQGTVSRRNGTQALWLTFIPLSFHVHIAKISQFWLPQTLVILLWMAFQLKVSFMEEMGPFRTKLKAMFVRKEKGIETEIEMWLTLLEASAVLIQVWCVVLAQRTTVTRGMQQPPLTWHTIQMETYAGLRWEQ